MMSRVSAFYWVLVQKLLLSFYGTFTLIKSTNPVHEPEAHVRSELANPRPLALPAFMIQVSFICSDSSDRLGIS